MKLLLCPFLVSLLTSCACWGIFSQEVPPTPGQPVKEPMFIPVAVGLLDSTGKDIALSSVYHDGKIQSISSNDEPVYSTVLRVTKVRAELLCEARAGLIYNFILFCALHIVVSLDVGFLGVGL